MSKFPLSPIYSRYLTSEEKRAIRSVPVDDISSEINLVRGLSILFLKFQQSAPDDLASRMQALRTFTLLSAQLAILVRSIDPAHNPLGDSDAILAEALDNVPFDIPKADLLEKICPKNTAASPEIETLTNMASIQNILAPTNAKPFPISP